MGIGQTVRQASVQIKRMCLWYRRDGFCDLVWVDFEDFSVTFDGQWDDDGQITFLFNLILYMSFTMKKQPTTA